MFRKHDTSLGVQSTGRARENRNRRVRSGDDLEIQLESGAGNSRRSNTKSVTRTHKRTPRQRDRSFSRSSVSQRRGFARFHFTLLYRNPRTRRIRLRNHDQRLRDELSRKDRAGAINQAMANQLL